MRIWDAVDDERNKVLIFSARGFAQDAGLVPPNAPLLMAEVACSEHYVSQLVLGSGGAFERSDFALQPHIARRQIERFRGYMLGLRQRRSNSLHPCRP